MFALPQLETPCRCRESRRCPRGAAGGRERTMSRVVRKRLRRLERNAASRPGIIIHATDEADKQRQLDELKASRLNSNAVRPAESRSGGA